MCVCVHIYIYKVHRSKMTQRLGLALKYFTTKLEEGG